MEGMYVSSSVDGRPRWHHQRRAPGRHDSRMQRVPHHRLSRRHRPFTPAPDNSAIRQRPERGPDSMTCRAIAIVLLALACASPAIAGGSPVKARLSSANAGEEVGGVLTLNGYDLAGHLSGGGINVTITGTVKSSSVSVVVTGHISPSCNLNG